MSECMRHLHPYHHKMVAALPSNPDPDPDPDPDPNPEPGPNPNPNPNPNQVAAFRLNVGRVPLAGGQRAELFCQFADARIRLVSDELDPLAAADLERAGVSFRAAGDVHSAARLFGCASRGYTAHLGADSAEARRCLQALAALG